MSTTAQQLIEAAYARSTSNDAGKLATDGELLNQLNRKYQSMHAMMAVSQRDNALAKTALTFAGAPPSVALPTDIIDIVRLETATATRVYLIPSDEKDRTWHLQTGMAVFRVGATLVSRGLASDPIAGTVLTMYYTDAPAAITALNSTLDARFPVRFEMILVLDLAIYLSVKDTNRDANQFGALKDEYMREYQNFLAMIGLSNTAMNSPHVARNAAGSAS